MLLFLQKLVSYMKDNTLHIHWVYVQGNTSTCTYVITIVRNYGLIYSRKATIQVGLLLPVMLYIGKLLSKGATKQMEGIDSRKYGGCIESTSH